MKRVLFSIALAALVISSALYSCGGGSTPTQGTQKVYIDESYEQLFLAETEAFEGIYKNSNLETKYLPEGEIMEEFLKDSCRIIVLSRDLNDKEKDYFKSRNSFPVSTKIASDALAFITHKDNPVKDLLYQQVEDIFTGKTTSWRMLDAAVKAGSGQDTSINIVFDNERSSNVRLIRERLLSGGTFPSNCFAVKSNQEVIEHVSRNPGALGIIGVNWISDKDDSLTRSFMDKVQVLGVSPKDDDGNFIQPYQAHIYAGTYPFIRDVYIINREGRTGLGTGFAAFVAGEKGQLIILKAGMVPATQPVRMVTIKSE